MKIVPIRTKCEKTLPVRNNICSRRHMHAAFDSSDSRTSAYEQFRKGVLFCFASPLDELNSNAPMWVDTRHIYYAIA